MANPSRTSPEVRKSQVFGKLPQFKERIIIPRYSVERKVDMTEVSREEMNAKLEAVEARLEAKFISIDGKLDNLLSEIKHVGETAKDAKIAASNIKWNVLATAVGTVGVVGAVILAMWAVGYQIADILNRPPLTPPS
jgi:hypothetical protein